MNGQDDMKAGLLQELIEKLMEMKDGGQSDQGHEAELGKLQGDALSGGPDKGLAMLEIKKEGDDLPESKPGMDPADCDDDGPDMKKPLGDGDFQALRRKYKMGL